MANSEGELARSRTLCQELREWSPSGHHDYCPCSPKNDELKAAREALSRAFMDVVASPNAEPQPEDRLEQRTG